MEVMIAVGDAVLPTSIESTSAFDPVGYTSFFCSDPLDQRLCHASYEDYNGDTGMVFDSLEETCFGFDDNGAIHEDDCSELCVHTRCTNEKLVIFTSKY